MRRLGLLLLALFLVNLPFVHQTWTDWQLDRSGEEVRASVVDTQDVDGRLLVDYRLPRSVDPDGARFSARVDRPTFDQARETDTLPVRVLPDDPARNQPVGAVPSRLFLVVALLGDLTLLLVGVVGYRRWRARSAQTVVTVDGDDVTLDSGRGRLTATGPLGWAGRLQPGQPVRGELHLVVEHEVLPGGSVAGFEQVGGSSYVVRGRVVDARTGLVVLELADGSRLRVETGRHRIRADIRDPTEVRGTLCFTPSRS